MTESILQIKDLRKSFGDNEILKGISLDVKQGEVVVILGSSGFVGNRPCYVASMAWRPFKEAIFSWMASLSLVARRIFT